MYLAELRCWNFRKYGPDSLSSNPSLIVNFNKNLNLIVGENDGGKTSIIDAIKFVLGTQSYDTLRLDETDFFRSLSGKRETELKIECVFKELTSKEAGAFIEWINFDSSDEVELRVRIIATIKDNKITYRRTAGRDGLDMNFDVNELLRVTYLKPLRDAENELSPGYRSRFAQILKSHPIFTTDQSEEHEIVTYMKTANNQIEDYFKVEKRDERDAGGVLVNTINKTLSEFIGVNNSYEAKVNISDIELTKILNKLMLSMDDNKAGLGSLNQLYIAMELLLLELKSKNNEYGLALIEEIEAHLHPQAQLRVIKYLQSEIKQQVILTTHSITLASSIDLKHLIICKNGKAYSMGSEYTGLNSGDYDFLQRFLDATKSNLFFAKGVIFVEGDAENILIPTIAKLIGYPLHKYGISIVNVGNTAFLRYSKIFIRKESTDTIGVPVAIVTDLDVRPPQYYIDPDNCKTHTTTEEITAENPTEEAGVQDDTITETDSKDKEQPYSIYKLKEIPELESIFFKKEVDAKAKLREYLNKSRLTAQDKNKYLEEINDYEQCKKLTQEEKEQKYNVSNTIKVFVNTWTLEYDLALSSIREYVLAAITIAEAINSDEDIIDNINLDTYISEATDKINNFILDGDTREDIAYLIYKPLLKNKASKAIAAQYLASILSIKVNDGTINSEQIVSDPHLNYIINAIKHVAIPLKEEEE